MTLVKTKKDKEEFVSLISDAFQEVMIPALEDMETRIKRELGQQIDSIKGDTKETRKDVESLNRKFDAQQERLDRHGKQIEKFEKIHPKGKHNFIGA